jgi:hypothetical protein
LLTTIVRPLRYAETAQLNYGRTVKTFLLQHAHVEAIVQFPARQLVFEHAVTTAAVTLIRKRADDHASRRTRFVHAPSISRNDIVRAFTDDTAAMSVHLRAVRSGRASVDSGARRRHGSKRSPVFGAAQRPAATSSSC